MKQSLLDRLIFVSGVLAITCLTLYILCSIWLLFNG